LNIQDDGGRHLEKSQKSRYLRNGLTDLYEIWHAGAKWGLFTSMTVNKSLNFTNPRWRIAAIFQTVKLPYLCNRLTDFDEILHGDAHCSLTADRPLKFRIFKNLKNYKNRDISATV